MTAFEVDKPSWISAALLHSLGFTKRTEGRQRVNRERILDELKAERDRLDDAIQALETASSNSLGRAARVSGNGRRKRTHRLTPAGRRRLSEMMKKRWAERRKKMGRRGSSATSGKAQGRRRNRLTPEGRKRLSEMMRARWAARRKNASKAA